MLGKIVKRNIDKLRFIKIFNFAMEENEMADKTIHWEKIFANYINNKGLVSKIHIKNSKIFF
jgi:hypothetical protein